MTHRPKRAAAALAANKIKAAVLEQTDAHHKGWKLKKNKKKRERKDEPTERSEGVRPTKNESQHLTDGQPTVQDIFPRHGEQGCVAAAKMGGSSFERMNIPSKCIEGHRKEISGKLND